MVITISGYRIMIGRRHLVIALGLTFAGLTLLSAGFGLISVIFVLGLMYLLLHFATKPFSRFIARLGYSIRWKFEVGLAVVAIIFLLVSLISLRSMDFMHDELHKIQDLEPSQPSEIFQAVNDLEDTRHGFLAELTPLMSVLGVLMASTLGAAMA